MLGGFGCFLYVDWISDIRNAETNAVLQPISTTPNMSYMGLMHFQLQF